MFRGTTHDPEFSSDNIWYFVVCICLRMYVICTYVLWRLLSRARASEMKLPHLCILMYSLAGSLPHINANTPCPLATLRMLRCSRRDSLLATPSSSWQRTETTPRSWYVLSRSAKIRCWAHMHDRWSDHTYVRFLHSRRQFTATTQHQLLSSKPTPVSRRNFSCSLRFGE